MNTEHRALCASPEWGERLAEQILPWALPDAELPDLVLEVGPGPGAATDVLRERTRRLLAVEYDAELAADLRHRFAGDPVVDVLRGDAAALPVPDATVDAVVAFTMLHHLPDTAAQDRALAQFARVLRPGGWFAGTDSLDSPGLRQLHEGDTLVPLDPLTVADRLRAAGFAEVDVEVMAFGVRFAGRVPPRPT